MRNHDGTYVVTISRLEHIKEQRKMEILSFSKKPKQLVKLNKCKELVRMEKINMIQDCDITVKIKVYYFFVKNVLLLNKL